MIFLIYIKCQKTPNMSDSPKIGNYKLRSRKKETKELSKKKSSDSGSDSDSSSDYHPGDDLGDQEMNNLELQNLFKKYFLLKAARKIKTTRED